MTPDELRKLIAQEENPKLDFKSKFYKIDDPDPKVREIHWDEFIKDILALANGNVNHAYEDGYLIVGVGDKLHSDGTRDLYDTSPVKVDVQQILQKINAACYPQLSDLTFARVPQGSYSILVFTVPRTPFLLETTRAIGEHKEYPKSTVFVRRRDAIGTATQKECRAIEAEKERLSSMSKPEILATENRSLDFITDPDVLLAKLYTEENDDDPLAHHNIPYQQRDPKNDIQRALRSALGPVQRYLLITAPTGLGKTREAAMLAQRMMKEGYRIVRVKPGLLEVPSDLPAELKDNPRHILIILDDLGQLFRRGGKIASPTAGQSKPETLEPSYHDSLLRLLNAFEKWCGEDEVRVIATARDEPEHWKVLHFNSRDPLWKRFGKPIRLSPPHVSAFVKLLGEATTRANLKAERDDFNSIASRNDGKFTTVIENLRYSQRINQVVASDTFAETLENVLREQFQQIAHRRPAVRYIYDAIDILDQFGIDLYTWVVEPTACLMWGGNTKQRAYRKRQVNLALRDLVEKKRIFSESGGQLVLRDGQIEAKGAIDWQAIDWASFVAKLHRLVLRLAKKKGNLLSFSLLRFGDSLCETGNLEEAEAVLRQARNQPLPIAEYWQMLSAALYHLKEATYGARHEVFLMNELARILSSPTDLSGPCVIPSDDKMFDEELSLLAEAEAACRKAIELDPNDPNGYNILGVLLATDPARYEEAEVAYRRTIELAPDAARPYSNLGLLIVKDSTRTAEAEELYRKALALEPDLAIAHNNLGLLLSQDLSRYTEAEEVLRKGLELDQGYSSLYQNLGLLLLKMDPPRNDEADEIFLKLIELEPRNYVPWYVLGIHDANDPARRELAEPILRKTIELAPGLYDAYIRLADVLFEDKTRHPETEEVLRKAIEVDPNNSTAYRKLGILMALDDNIEGEDFLRKAIELDPSDVDAYAFLGLWLPKMSRYAEAEDVLRKAIELNPESSLCYGLLGAALVHDQSRHTEAEDAYRRAIEIDPANTSAYGGLIQLLRSQGREHDLLSLLEDCAAHNPQEWRAWLSLASIQKQLGDIESSADGAAKARALIVPTDWYNLACLESISGNADRAFTYLLRATEQPDFDPKQAQDEPDLQWIRDDPRFAEIVVVPPEEDGADE